ncbi:dTDP-4-dehydrorhamnose 3,5-epimerase [Escherichia coli]|uniref:dTDP-4-dehydrorhamnose 3,5-epimerase n=1 Tax=Escherichia coli TaxID=562 RepID=UPI00050AAE49|nr:dTDP-4-dehydrorhamnose 3,5-epimerase [Escherichia coli]EER7969802.1 dTDP-4-dehydrorhamnose 3,5-epimerase [Escherichia coli]EES4285822.1 dTDP-4-dehydrorhamnose 3,5-epimerase [Escherichia coli]EET0633967.1 dTDP-4-dehydrorhamnose 3,5-epimerase [Escherichia coli]EET1862662.1 dTDP-4-dehydrorhamnose 3,5-epimerase [Escherichia coli]EET3654787.1 dTDP-4-dehydrorhamnose 3,5-epimerase [Escherichia coli]
MKYSRTTIQDAIVITPEVFADSRGYFFESFNYRDFQSIINREIVFCQDNQSLSHKGVVRGLHFQVNPKEQAKLVRCINGSVYDVIVDLRKNSPSYKGWFGILLSSDNKKQLWIPEGCAHGFISLEDNTELLYKTTEFYSPDHERCIIWNDPDLGISWPEYSYIISDKDKNGISFAEWESLGD